MERAQDSQKESDSDAWMHAAKGGRHGTRSGSRCWIGSKQPWLLCWLYRMNMWHPLPDRWLHLDAARRGRWRLLVGCFKTYALICIHMSWQKYALNTLICNHKICRYMLLYINICSYM
jgi:hypothetical protein